MAFMYIYMLGMVYEWYMNNLWEVCFLGMQILLKKTYNNNPQSKDLVRFIYFHAVSTTHLLYAPKSTDAIPRFLIQRLHHLCADTIHILLLLLSVDSRECWNRIFLIPCAILRCSVSPDIFPIQFPQHGYDGFLSRTFTTGVPLVDKSALVTRIGVDGNGENWAMNSYPSSLSAPIKRGLRAMPLRLDSRDRHLIHLCQFVQTVIPGERMTPFQTINLWFNKLQSTQSNFFSTSLSWSLMFLMIT